MQRVVAVLVAALLLVLGTAALASQDSWRIRIMADDGYGNSFVSGFSLGVYPTSVEGLDAQDGTVPYTGVAGDTPGTCVHTAAPFPEGAYMKNIKAPTLPIPEKTWDFVVAANINFSGSQIRLTVATVSSTTFPTSTYFDAASGRTYHQIKYYIRMIDNKGVPGASPVGTMWEIPIPTVHSATVPYWRCPVNEPAIKMSAKSNEALLAEGYRFQFVQKAIVPEPSSLLALASGLVALGGLIRRRK